MPQLYNVVYEELDHRIYLWDTNKLVVAKEVDQVERVEASHDEDLQ